MRLTQALEVEVTVEEAVEAAGRPLVLVPEVLSAACRDRGWPLAAEVAVAGWRHVVARERWLEDSDYCWLRCPWTKEGLWVGRRVLADFSRVPLEELLVEAARVTGAWAPAGWQGPAGVPRRPAVPVRNRLSRMPLDRMVPEVPLSEVLAALGNPLVFAWPQVAAVCEERGWTQALEVARPGPGVHAARIAGHARSRWVRPTPYARVECPRTADGRWGFVQPGTVGRSSYEPVFGDFSRAGVDDLLRAAEQMCGRANQQRAALPAGRTDQTWATRDWVGRFGVDPVKVVPQLLEAAGCRVVHRLDAAAWARAAGHEQMADLFEQGGMQVTHWMMRGGLMRVPPGAAGQNATMFADPRLVPAELPGAIAVARRRYNAMMAERVRKVAA